MFVPIKDEWKNFCLFFWMTSDVFLSTKKPLFLILYSEVASVLNCEAEASHTLWLGTPVAHFLGLWSLTATLRANMKLKTYGGTQKVNAVAACVRKTVRGISCTLPHGDEFWQRRHKKRKKQFWEYLSSVSFKISVYKERVVRFCLTLLCKDKLKRRRQSLKETQLQTCVSSPPETNLQGQNRLKHCPWWRSLEIAAYLPEYGQFACRFAAASACTRPKRDKGQNSMTSTNEFGTMFLLFSQFKAWGEKCAV